MTRPFDIITALSGVEGSDLSYRPPTARPRVNSRNDNPLGRNARPSSILPPLSPRYRHRRCSVYMSPVHGQDRPSTASASAAPRPSPPLPSRRDSGHHVEAPNGWAADSVSHHDTGPSALPAFRSPHAHAPEQLAGAGDELIAWFLGNDFSSPSSYAPFTGTTAQYHQPNAASPQDTTTATAVSNDDHHPSPMRPNTRSRTRAAPPRTTTQLSASSAGDNSILSGSDLFGDQDLDESPHTSFTSSSSSSKCMPADLAAPHDEASSSDPTSPSNKRRRLSNLEQKDTTRLLSTGPEAERSMGKRAAMDDDPFGESSPKDQGRGQLYADGLTTIDLTEANEVPEELTKPDEDNRVKISSFQCVICMDDVTTLTVTHCGHLYCAQCLHSSLNVEATRGKCPMCRAKVDMKPRAQYKSNTKGFWPLQLKLMTSTRKGKRKADSLS